jgi:glycosyltransferase involved in cell wall biosynthesis
MRILFLSISSAISNLNNRGIYPDLLRKFVEEGHNIFIVAPAERRSGVKTNLKENGAVTTLLVQTPNITKTNLIEKGISTIIIDYLFYRAIQKYLDGQSFDLILYTTPPITFNRLIKKLKQKHNATTYLLLKDIFPQNAVDLGILRKYNPLYYYFRKKEKDLYKISNFIGCMSPANVNYLITKHPEISRDKIEVCPNSISPISLENFSETDKVRDKYGLPKDKVICIYGGNLGKPQGIDFLIEVLVSNKNRDDVYFIIAGSGTESYKIKTYCDKENPANVMFIPYLPKLKFDELVYASDIGLIFLDKRHTIPNYPSRLLNYLEFKKPVLMAIDRNTDVGKISEENKYGFWVESGQLEKFNQRLNLLISNQSLRLEMGLNGYQYLLNNYTVDHSYNIIMAHFSS